MTNLTVRKISRAVGVRSVRGNVQTSHITDYRVVVRRDDGTTSLLPRHFLSAELARDAATYAMEHLEDARTGKTTLAMLVGGYKA
jgi:hypothetical protein